MISEIFIEGRRVSLDPARSIGKGGEADVYDLGDGRAAKVFKSPDHPDHLGLPEARRMAEERIAIHQRKLPALCALSGKLPREVVAPTELLTNRSGTSVLGYAMPLVSGAEPLVRMSDPTYRRRGVSSRHVIDLFRTLFRAVRELHASNVVLGDFNDLNVLVTGAGEPWILDSDSFQFGTFPCSVFTERFVDPVLCDPHATSPRPRRPYEPASDWFAFNALLFQSLLFVGPYGGVHRPDDPRRRVSQGERPLRRITVFHPEVRYPKPAVDYRVLPDELLHHFHEVFERDVRAPFPSALLSRLTFTICPACGIEHARALCPRCSRFVGVQQSAAAPGALVTRGSVRCERLFTTRGVIVHASIDRGELRVVHHENGAYRLQDGTPILRGALDPRLRFRIFGDEILVGRGNELAVLPRAAGGFKLSVDMGGVGPAFDTNDRHKYWTFAGRLLRDEPSSWQPDAAVCIGDVLSNQTHVFVGPEFGLGFYRAGGLSRAFLFDAHARGINDELTTPPLRGELVELTAALDDKRAWLLLALKQSGRVRHLCLVYTRGGQLEASAEGEPGDGSWLSTLGGKCAARGVLFAPTDAGVVRLEVIGGAILKTREFPETEELVDESCQLLVERRGLCVVRPHEVVALQSRQP